MPGWRAMASDLRKVTFSYPGSVSGPVALIGSFNQWSPLAHPLRHTDREWRIEVFLPPGTYPYAFVIDGHVGRDPSGHAFHGPLGAQYSVLTIAG